MLLYWSCVFSVLISVEALKSNERVTFLKDFIKRTPGPANVVSFIKNTGNSLDMGKELFAFGIRYMTMNSLRFSKKDHHVIYVADIKDLNTLDVLAQAEASKLLLAPSRWLLFFGNNECIGYTETATLLENTNSSIETGINDLENFKNEVNIILSNINIAINTEVYIALDSNNTVELFEVYRKQKNWPLVWDHNGSWVKELRGFREPPPRAVLAVRRRNMERLPLTATTVFTKNDTLKNMEEFKRRDVNTLSKYCFHMGLHVASWLNATLRVNITSTWGYRLGGHTYNGMVGELQTGRADFSGTAFNPTTDRLSILEYLVSPGPLTATFMFRRPALAATGNIYLLPFSTGVWMATGVLLLISAFMLFLTTYREPKYISRGDTVMVPERLLDSLHDTLCLVFQQGTPKDPVSITSRQVLLMGLMAFMFLYTAYSAYVVALLQSSTDIKSVGALARSPLQLGLEDVVYAKNILPLETGEDHKMLWKKRIEPQGDKAYYTVQEGIRKVREGMFAFHVEKTVGYMEIQKTFTEDEKCNLADIQYLTSRYLYIGVSLRSQVKEQIRIGLHRVLEVGLQSHSERRVLEKKPKCGAGVAVFTAVQLRDVSPAFHVTLTGYAIALIFLFIEKKPSHSTKKASDSYF